MSDRIKIQTYKTVSWDYLTLDELLESVKDAIETYGGDARFDLMTDDYDEYCKNMIISYEREENPSEEKRRLEMSKIAERHERKRYEELKKKFEGDEV